MSGCNRLVFSDDRDDPLLNDCLEQRILVLVVEIERSFRNAGARGNVFQSSGGKAFFNKQTERGLEKLGGASFLAAFAGSGKGGNGNLMTRWSLSYHQAYFPVNGLP